MRALILAAVAASAVCGPALATETIIQCDVKLDLPGGRLEAVIFGDGKVFGDASGRATLIVPVDGESLMTDPPNAFDLTDPVGRTAEYRVQFRWEWYGANPPPAFSTSEAKHPWWPVGDQFVGPALPASATPDKDWTYAVWAAKGEQVKAANYIYAPTRAAPHRGVVGVEVEQADNEAEAIRHANQRTAFIKALSAGDSFVLFFVNRQNERLGAAEVDTRLLKAIPDLSDRAHEKAARMHRAGQCRVSKL